MEKFKYTKCIQTEWKCLIQNKEKAGNLSLIVKSLHKNNLQGGIKMPGTYEQGRTEFLRTDVGKDFGYGTVNRIVVATKGNEVTRIGLGLIPDKKAPWVMYSLGQNFVGNKPAEEQQQYVTSELLQVPLTQADIWDGRVLTPEVQNLFRTLIQENKPTARGSLEECLRQAATLIDPHHNLSTALSLAEVQRR